MTTICYPFFTSEGLNNLVELLFQRVAVIHLGFLLHLIVLLIQKHIAFFKYLCQFVKRTIRPLWLIWKSIGVNEQKTNLFWPCGVVIIHRQIKQPIWAPSKEGKRSLSAERNRIK